MGDAPVQKVDAVPKFTVKLQTPAPDATNASSEVDANVTQLLVASRRSRMHVTGQPD